MTPQEVINIIEDVTWQDNGRHYGKIAPAREIAISALEKQTPKKVSVIEMPCENIYFCPNCNNAIPHEKYCSNCGQALDWGDTE